MVLVESAVYFSAPDAPCWPIRLESLEAANPADTTIHYGYRVFMVVGRGTWTRSAADEQATRRIAGL